MRSIYLEFLTKKKDAKRLSYDELVERTAISKSKLQRVFTGQVEVTVTDLEIIVEQGLGASMRELYALVGEQEFKASEELDFKGAKELVAEFSAERAKLEEAHQLEKKIMRESHEESKRLMREEHALQIEKLKALRIELQDQFQQNTNLLTERYNANSKYLTEHVAKIERLNDQLTERAVKAEEIAQAAQGRASRAEKRIDDLDKRRHHVFWGMLSVILILIGVIIASFIFNLPAIGWGNL